MQYAIYESKRYGQPVYEVIVFLDDLVLAQSVFMDYRGAQTYAANWINKYSLPTNNQ